MYIPHSYLKAAILACEQAPGKGEKIGKSSTPDSSTCQILFFFFYCKTQSGACSQATAIHVRYHKMVPRGTVAKA